MKHRSAGRYFPGLDAVRALGATAVLGTHVAFQTGRYTRGPLGNSLARLDIGVALFFVLSGFLLFRPYAQAAVLDRTRWPKARPYLVKRALRILPAYWLAVLACLLLFARNEGHRGPAVWLQYLTLTRVYFGGPLQFGLTQMWSLCTEVAFYLALPLLALLVLGRRGTATGRRPLIALGLLASVSVGWQVLVTQTGFGAGRAPNDWLPGYLDWFGAGMALALVQVRLGSRTATPWMRGLADLARSPGTCWAASLALFAVATSPLAGPVLYVAPTTWDAVVKNLLYAACSALVVLPFVLGPQDRGASALLGTAPVRWLGEVSYGVFLWHLLVLQGIVDALGQEDFHGSWVTTFVLTWSASVAVAMISYLVVERPALRLGETGWHERGPDRCQGRHAQQLRQGVPAGIARSRPRVQRQQPTRDEGCEARDRGPDVLASEHEQAGHGHGCRGWSGDEHEHAEEQERHRPRRRPWSCRGQL